MVAGGRFSLATRAALHATLRPPQQEMASIVDKLMTLPDDTVVLPGHMQETSVGQERQTNPFVLEELQRRKGE